MDASTEDSLPATTPRATWGEDDRAPRILFFGTYDEELHPRVRVLREGLAAHGAVVEVINRPLGVGTAQRVEMLRRPRLLGAFVVALTRVWVGLVVASLRHRGRSAPDVVVVGYLGHLDVHLARLLFRRSTIVLDHLVGLSDTAEDRRLQGRIDPLLRRIDDWALRSADVVVFDTEEQKVHLGGSARRSVVVPVGAPIDFFEARERRTVDRSVLRVLFFGLFTPLQGAETIASAIAKLGGDPRIHFTIVGTGQDHDAATAATEDASNIHWIDWVPSTELPSVVAAHDVCLGIFGLTSKALRVVPNKVYQGLATGAAVVTSDTPSQRATLGRAAAYVAPGDADGLADMLGQLARCPELLEELQDHACRCADELFTPWAVVRPLVGVLDDR